MSKIKLITLFFSLIITANSYSQEYQVFGKIYDVRSNKPLDFVNVKVADSSYGTEANKNGEYFIKLNSGSNKLIFSCIGYYSDTIDVFIENQDLERNIYLTPSEIVTETIEVFGEDPAVEIVRKAIEYKKRFRENLNEYDFSAYTKYVIRSNTGSVNKNEVKPDSGKYPIFSIMESETNGYFKKPDLYKEIVKSRREAENEMVSGLALPFIVNFYDEQIDFGMTKIKNPLADDALDYYNYKLLGTTSIDSQVVYRIEVKGSGLYPLFNGKIYIANSVYALLKIDLTTNDAVNISGIDKMNFKQKFTSYSDKKNEFWMPSDVQIYADGSFAGLFNFSFDIFTIVSNYDLNKKAPEGIFDDYIIKVLPNAKKDSSYWSKNQLIKNTDEEKNAYSFLAKESKKSNQSIEFGFPDMRIGKNLSLFSDLPYHYNRVEGNFLDFSIQYRSNSRRLNFDSFFGYGFADKKTKYEVDYSQSFLKDKSFRIEAGVFKKLQPISYDLSNFFRLLNTFTSLFDKMDYYDYYYASGFNFTISKLLLPQIDLTLKYNEEKQTSAFNNTTYSIRKHDELFRYNPAINDAFQRIVGISLTLNPNKFKYADFGNDNTMVFPVTDFPILTLGLDFSFKKLGSTYENKRYSAELSGENYFNNFLNIKYTLGTVAYFGEVPFQSLAYFNASSAVWDKSFSFKTMKYREYLGDKIFYLNFENNFKNILWSKIPLIRKFDLIGFFNAAKSEISSSNLFLASDKKFSILGKVFCEAGFGVKGILNLIRLDFAWRLTNRIKGRNFNFSLSFGF